MRNSIIPFPSIVTAMKLLPFLCLPFIICSCETTGDPNQGGLFGWSSKKADQRLIQRQTTLDGLEQDTSSQRRRSAWLESQAGR
jgi:hypothetical protein